MGRRTSNQWSWKRNVILKFKILGRHSRRTVLYFVGLCVIAKKRAKPPSLLLAIADYTNNIRHLVDMFNFPNSIISTRILSTNFRKNHTKINPSVTENANVRHMKLQTEKCDKRNMIPPDCSFTVIGQPAQDCRLNLKRNSWRDQQRPS